MALPGYTVRESPKAKHVSLKLSRLGKLEIIVPKGFDQQRIPEILQRKQRWIERTTERFAAQRSQLVEESQEPPQQIILHALGETLQVAYCPPSRLGFNTFEKQGKLTVWAEPDHPETCRELLRQWLAGKAQTHLIPWLREVSQEIHLPFATASIRGQKTRWASCSGRKTISLNYRLLFLPAPLVRYVFVHELCHTVHLNHSSNFWSLVNRHEPNWQHLDRELDQAQQFIPLWVEKPET